MISVIPFGVVVAVVVLVVVVLVVVVVVAIITIITSVRSSAVPSHWFGPPPDSQLQVRVPEVDVGIVARPGQPAVHRDRGVEHRLRRQLLQVAEFVGF